MVSFKDTPNVPDMLHKKDKVFIYKGIPIRRFCGTILKCWLYYESDVVRTRV